MWNGLSASVTHMRSKSYGCSCIDLKALVSLSHPDDFFSHPLATSPSARSCELRLISNTSSPVFHSPQEEGILQVQEWVQEHQQQALAASNWYPSTTCLAEHVPALDDSGDQFLSSLLFSEYDFTDTFDTALPLFNLDNPTVGDTSTMGAQLGDGSLLDWEPANANLLPAASNQHAIDTRTSSSPDHNFSPIFSSSSSDRTNNIDLSFNNSGSRSGSSLSKKRPAAEFSNGLLTPSSTSRFDETERITKRHRNTEAARRYRQRKMDRVTELEDALEEIRKERDDLKLKLARSEAEADVLRGILKKG